MSQQQGPTISLDDLHKAHATTAKFYEILIVAKDAEIARLEALAKAQREAYQAEIDRLNARIKEFEKRPRRRSAAVQNAC